LKPYFRRHGINGDFSAIEKAPPAHLLTSLSMLCPFAPREKQALLEAADPDTRAELLITLIEMSAHAPPGGDDAPRH